MSTWITSSAQVSIQDDEQRIMTICTIECDAVSDLPAVDYFDGISIYKGSNAHVIADNTVYKLNSSGTWVIQDESPFKDVYTKSEINSLLSDYTTTADQQLIDGAQDADITALETILTNITDIHLVRNTVQNYIGLSIQDATGKRIRLIFGRLNSTTNYLQLYGGDNDFIDKGYITFDVSRNIDTWSSP